MSTGTGFAQPISGSAGEDRDQRKQHGADPVDVRERIQRQPPEQPRRRIAETVGGPRVRRLVKRQRHDQDDEARMTDSSASNMKIARVGHRSATWSHCIILRPAK